MALWDTRTTKINYFFGKSLSTLAWITGYYIRASTASTAELDVLCEFAVTNRNKQTKLNGT
jgi:hypothetical protein